MGDVLEQGVLVGDVDAGDLDEQLTSTLLGALERTDGRYGLQVMCEAGGQANAMILERP